MFKSKIQKRLTLILLFVFMCLLTVGCSALDTLSSLKARFSGSEGELVVEEPMEEDWLLETEAELFGETRDIVLYFSNEDGTALVAEQRTIPKVEGIARATINELIAGPHPESGLQSTIPEGTVLKDINIRPDGLAIVDFSSELITNFMGDSNAETLAVYSIVNTLTQFDTVDEVQILVDGKIVDTIGGHVSVATAMTRDEGLIQ
ncbi:MAG: GerMN domain-containing protein [Zhaonellaceae bacterium]|nr:GerMN domain-containing protein [Clostridia bacterium]